MPSAPAGILTVPGACVAGGVIVVGLVEVVGATVVELAAGAGVLEELSLSPHAVRQRTSVSMVKRVENFIAIDYFAQSYNLPHIALSS